MAVAKKKQTLPQKKSKITKPSVKRFVDPLKKRMNQYVARRPHRSFRKTHRRDYERSLTLPGYMAFTIYVYKILWQNKGSFLWVILFYGLFTGIFSSMASQDTYGTLSETLRETSSEIFGGDFGAVSQAGLLFLTGMTVGFTEAPSELQQVYGALFGLLAWLTTVWLLRGILSGKKPTFRDALYNAGAPIVPTILVGFFLLLQLLPGAVGVMLISAIIGSELAGAVSMIFTVVAGLLILLSLYWVTSTLVALVVVTLPGIYPLQAIRAAGDMVIGRRLRILLRWVWLFGVTFVIWAVLLIPIMLFDAWIKGLWPAIQWVPIVPVALLLVGSFSVVFTSGYIYLLYRKVVEDDAKPA